MKIITKGNSIIYLIIICSCTNSVDNKGITKNNNNDINDIYSPKTTGKIGRLDSLIGKLNIEYNNLIDTLIYNDEIKNNDIIEEVLLDRDTVLLNLLIKMETNLAQEKFNNTIKYGIKIIKHEPKFSTVYKLLGDSYFKIGQIDSSKFYYYSYLKNTGSTDLFMLANIYEYENNFKNAILLINKSIAASKNEFERKIRQVKKLNFLFRNNLDNEAEQYLSKVYDPEYFYSEMILFKVLSNIESNNYSEASELLIALNEKGLIDGLQILNDYLNFIKSSNKDFLKYNCKNLSEFESLVLLRYFFKTENYISFCNCVDIGIDNDFPFWRYMYICKKGFE